MEPDTPRVMGANSNSVILSAAKNPSTASWELATEDWKLTMLGREEKISTGRLTSVQYAILLMFLVLGYGLWRLQVSQTNYYATQAENNRVRKVPILAPRGKIVDREKELKGWLREKKIALIESFNPRWADLAEKWGWRMLFPQEAIRDQK